MSLLVKGQSRSSYKLLSLLSSGKPSNTHLHQLVLSVGSIKSFFQNKVCNKHRITDLFCNIVSCLKMYRQLFR